MNADAFRDLYEYHFAENRKVWNEYITPLSQDQFTQPLGYSHGSVQNQIVHLMQVDEVWFTQLRGADFPPDLTPAQLADRNFIRTYWDRVERDMRAYLVQLQDGMLLEKPFAEGEDKDLILWQVLIHVVNHGTDHRAQLLRLVNDLGIKTVSQDYIFYAYEHP